jgi:broad specificity phosphatase PhoE
MERKIYFTRHGETEDNVISRLSTKPPGPSLTALGRNQAVELRKEIIDLKISKIYSSPLTRAIETADIINKDLGVEIVKDSRISELLVGDREGRTDPVVFEEMDTVWKEWSLNNNLSVIAGPNGETAEQVLSRCRSFINDLIHNSNKKNILVIAHGGVLQLLLGHLCENLEPIFCYNNWLRNCQLVESKIVSDQLICTKWGQMVI